MAKNIAHFRIFKDHNPIARTFQGQEFPFAKDLGNPAFYTFKSVDLLQQNSLSKNFSYLVIT